MANIIGRITAPRIVGRAQGRKIIASPFVPAGPPATITTAVRSLIGRTRPAPPVGRTQPAPPPTQPPVLFFAEASVPAGGEAPLRSEALSNRTGRPVEIREIRFSAWVAAQGNVLYFDLGAVMSARILVDGKSVTHGFVPWWCLGKLEQIESQVAVADTVGTDAAFAAIVWRLSRPWYLRPGAKVEVQLRHSGALKYAVQGQVALAGHFASRPKTTASVPYAAAWVSPAFEYDEVVTHDSDEGDLVNVTKRVVTVDRLIARAGALFNMSGTTNLALLDFRIGAPLDYVKIRAQMSDGKSIIPTYQPFAAIFGFDRALEAVHMLASEHYYSVSVQKSAGPSLTTAYTTWQGRAYVGVIGWREEDTR
jgi:hypothetical protein